MWGEDSQFQHGSPVIILLGHYEINSNVVKLLKFTLVFLQQQHGDIPKSYLKQHGSPSRTLGDIAGHVCCFDHRLLLPPPSFCLFFPPPLFLSAVVGRFTSPPTPRPCAVWFTSPPTPRLSGPAVGDPNRSEIRTLPLLYRLAVQLFLHIHTRTHTTRRYLYICTTVAQWTTVLYKYFSLYRDDRA